MNWRSITNKFLLAAFFVACDILAFAQPPGGPPPGGGGTQGTNPPCWDPECVPVDSGVWFLLLAGTLLGVKLIYSQKNKSRV